MQQHRRLRLSQVDLQTSEEIQVSIDSSLPSLDINIHYDKMLLVGCSQLDFRSPMNLVQPRRLRSASTRRQDNICIHTGYRSMFFLQGMEILT